jgi:ribonucleoside-diphosphate reductase alpha chain
MRFEPSGFTGNKDIPIAKSILDYIFRWLSKKFLPADELPKTMDNNDEVAVTASLGEVKILTAPSRERAEQEVFQAQADAPPCHTCGSIMVRSGSCYKCRNCGETSGCS